MEDISEFQQRLARALDRIGAGLEHLHPERPAPAPDPAPEPPAEAAPAEAPEPAEPAIDPAELEALRGEVEAEREFAAQLQERLTASKSRYEAQIAELRDELERTRKVLADTDADRNRVRAVADDLHEACEALRHANAEGVGEAHLINSAVMTELETARAMRRSDRAELDAIIELLGRALPEAPEKQPEDADA
ncbi:hypothetical protein E2L08_01295 [Palleronia sediminis]|uniref:Uncharacterized protein n=1 Tax=Palleronia sediminis TaxID=2547833 RepID=A0A4R6AL35_9RHOB|nr:hypothetical protein [Palleronia sediminis]TDL84135.1 hypothetical protein E2L08_01295 [Palleronia sediminis]